MGSGKHAQRIRSSVVEALSQLARSSAHSLRVLHIAANTSKSGQLREDIVPFITELSTNSTLEEGAPIHRLVCPLWFSILAVAAVTYCFSEYQRP